MPDRTTISLPQPVKEEIDAKKPDNLSYGAFLSGLISDTELITNEDLMARLDDLETTIPNQAANEVQNRMTRR
ncbi:hypothetical protein SAMN05421858_5107 [Haladaptatus litoreus]|uniref:Uncharacterized protein n=1 Tax=Haladaptatus litoreus TaxID=553468 RepID=A0A1N7FIV3_9EURY|nr:hypothetical protein [Haladaptatus litoreus]SIS00227.1 hypothetical protein SAMN05421858_5107 [Haladaptatus litoreus]